MTGTESRGYETRDDIPFEIVDLESRSDGAMTLEGHAAVFNRPAEIEDYRGTYHEMFLPGAFAQTINTTVRRSAGDKPIQLLFHHGQHEIIGKIPIGVIHKLNEDRTGLHVVASLHKNWMTDPIADAIRSKAIDGMSVRFRPVNEKWETRGDGRWRLHHEVALKELGPVLGAAYPDARCVLRSLEVELERIGEIERGTSQGAATEDEPTAAEVTRSEMREPPESTLESMNEVQERMRLHSRRGRWLGLGE